MSLPILQTFMIATKPISFAPVITVHNLFLMTMSALLACGIGFIVFQDIYYHGFHHSVCSSGSLIFHRSKPRGPQQRLPALVLLPQLPFEVL